MTIESIE